MLPFSNPIEKAWILDLNKAGRYETTLFIWRSESLNLEPIIYNGNDKDVTVLMI